MILNHMRYKGYRHPKFQKNLLTKKSILHINRISNPLIRCETHILRNKYVRCKNNEPKQATLFFSNQI